MRLTKPRIEPLSDAEFTEEQKELLAPMGGRVLNIFRTLVREPKAFKGFLGWGNYVLSRRNSLPEREREIVILRIGYLCKSGYEWTQHVAIGKRAGLSDDEIARLKRGADAGWSAADAALIRASDELHSGQFVSDATWAALRGHFSEKQCMDVVFTVGQYTQVSMILNTFGVQLDTGQTLRPRLEGVLGAMIVGAHRNPNQEQVIYGRPAAEAVEALANSFGARRLLLVTTRSLDRPGGIVAHLKSELGSRCVGVFSAIAAHSPRTDVIACAEFARKADADLLVAVGGGSVIDAVKVVQLALWADIHAPEDLGRFLGNGAAALEPGVRMIALPTTLSAAEFTPFAGVTDTTRASKEGYFHKFLAPRVVVLDPRLTLETPPRLWFSTGMKAVDHAVEILCHKDRAPFSDALAADGLQRLHRGLKASMANTNDLDARLECQFGMWLAISGIASGRGMGASHAIGHVLGGSYGVPHGLTSCVILPAVLAWNRPAIAEREGLIAGLLEQGGASASDAVKSLVRSLGLPTHLGEIGIEASQFPDIGKATMHDRGVQTNPRHIDGPDDIVEILQRAV